MENTGRSSVVANYIKEKLETNKDSLRLKAVFYGEQINIPSSPVVIVQPGLKHRDLLDSAGPGGRTDNQMTVYVDVLSSKVGPEQLTRYELDQISEDVEEYLHSLLVPLNFALEGLVIHGYVNDWDPGTTFIQNGQFRTVRLIWVGRSRTYLA